MIEDKKIIAFAGLAGDGKSLAARLTLTMLDEPRVEIFSFATMLKHCVKSMFQLEEEQVYGTKEQKEARDPYWGVSGRELMQYFGTEMVRGSLMESLHTKNLLRKIEQSSAKIVIIDDVRHEEEVKVIRALGGKLIRIKGYNQKKNLDYPKPEPRTAREWEYLAELGFSSSFIEFLKGLGKGKTHSSEKSLSADFEIVNDHALGVGSLRNSLEWAIVQEGVL